jgi:tripeptidyl-peptidase-2
MFVMGVELRFKQPKQNVSSRARLLFHFIQLAKHSRYERYEKKYDFFIGNTASGSGNEDKETVRRFPVVEDCTMEVCIAQFWNGAGSHEVDVKLDFYGFQAGVKGELYLNGSQVVHRLDVVSKLRTMDNVTPSVTLDTLQKTLRPTEHKIRPTTDRRDMLMNGKHMFELELTYQFKVSEDWGAMTPRLAAFGDFLYDSVVENCMVLTFDAFKKRLGSFSLYPKKVKLESKGDYVIRVQVRDESPQLLEKFTTTPMTIDIPLAKPINLSCYAAFNDVFVGSAKPKMLLVRGLSTPVFFNSVDAASLPKGASSGDVLVGSLCDASRKDTGSVVVKYVVPPTKASSSSSPPAVEAKDTLNDLQQAILDLKFTYLSKLKNAEELEQLEAELVEHTSDREYLLHKLERIPDEKTLSSEDAHSAIQLAQAVVDTVDEAALSHYFSVKEDVYGEVDKKKKQDMTKQKNALITGLYRLCRANVALLEQAPDADRLSTLRQHFSRYDKWAAKGEYKRLMLYTWIESHEHRYARALQAVDKWITSVAATGEHIKQLQSVRQERIKLLHQLNYTCWANHHTEAALVSIERF